MKSIPFLALITVCCCLVFVAINPPSWKLETDLSSLTGSGDGILSAQQQADLIKNFENKVIYVVSGSQEELVKRAAKKIQAVAESDDLFLTSTEHKLESTDAFIQAIKPYRFSLLTDQQKQSLSKKSKEDLIRESVTNLYKIDRQSLYVGILEDPLSLFDQWVNQVITAGVNPKVTVEDGIIYTANNSSEHGPELLGFINLQLTNSALDITTQQQLGDFNKLLNQTIFEEFPQIDLSYTGVAFHGLYAASQAKREIAVISIGSTVGIFILFLYIFRSLKPLMLCLLAVGFGFLVAISGATFFYGKLHIISVVFGSSLIGVAVDYGVHYYCHAKNSRQSVLRAIFPSLVLSVVSTVIAYISLWQTDLRVLKEVSLFSIMGLTASAVFVLATFPWLVKPALHQFPKGLTLWVNKLGDFWIQQKKKLWYLGILLSGIFVACLLFVVQISDSIRAFYSPPKHLLQTDLVVQDSLKPYSFTQFLVVKAESEEQLFSRLDTLTDKLKSSENNPKIQDFLAINQIVPSVEHQQENYELLNSKVFGDSGAAWQLLESLGVNANDLQSQKSAFKNSINHYLKVENISSFLPEQYQSLWIGEVNSDEFVSLVFIRLRDEFTLADLTLDFGDVTGFYHFDRISQISTNMAVLQIGSQQLLLLAYVLVAVLLLLYFREIRALLILAVPLCASMITVLILTALGVSLSLFHVLGLFLILGLGLDYTIFLYKKHEGDSNAQNIHNQSSMIAITLSATTSSLSFGLLALSSTPMIAQFGATVIIGCLANLLLAPVVIAETSRQVATVD